MGGAYRNPATAASTADLDAAVAQVLTWIAQSHQRERDERELRRHLLAVLRDLEQEQAA